MLVGLLLAALVLYSYLSFSRPLVQLSDIYGWIRRAEKFPTQMDDAFWIDGFYPVGYPIALKMAFGIMGDYLRAAKLLSLVGAALGLVAFYAIARSLLQPLIALLATAALALNPTWVDFAAMEGTDMPFAGLALSGIALVLAGLDRNTTRRYNWLLPLAGGAFLGLSYLVRYTGLAITTFLFFGVILTGLVQRRLDLRFLVLLLVGFAVVSASQTLKAYHLTGNLFYNTQYQNVWFGIYGHGDWGSNWQKAVQIKSFEEVLMQSPSALLKNLFGNLYQSVTSSEYTKFPLTFLVLPGMLLALFDGRRRAAALVVATSFLGFAAAISLAFINQRLLLFFMPATVLFAVYALARLPELVPDRLLEAGSVRFRPFFAAIGAGLMALLYLYVLWPNLHHPLSDEQAAKLELTRAIRARGITDPGKVYSLTFNLHDPYTPTITLYAQPWFMTGLHYQSMAQVAQLAREQGYSVVVTDTLGQWTAPGLDRAWRLDSARVLFNEFYSRAGVHGFEVKR